MNSLLNRKGREVKIPTKKRAHLFIGFLPLEVYTSHTFGVPLKNL